MMTVFSIASVSLAKAGNTASTTCEIAQNRDRPITDSRITGRASADLRLCRNECAVT